MNINEDVGIVHDIIFYNVVYFSRKNMFAHPVGLDFYQQAIQLPHYDALISSKNCPTPPESLFPFFHTDGLRSSVVTAYVNKHCNLFQLNTKNFLSLFLDKSNFKKFAITYYFGSSFNEKELQKLCLAEGETVARAMSILSETLSIKYFIDMFYHFNQLVDNMIDHLKELIPIITSYHTAHKTETLDILQRFISKENQCLIRKSVIIPDEETLISLDRQTFSVCYLDQSIIKSTSQGRKHFFVLGCDWAAYVSNAIDYRHVTMKSLMISLGHPTKIEIINELRKRELTISQLARRLQLARTSISRYIEDLLDELVIIKARKSGAEIYYRLNAIYFQYAKDTISKYLDDTLLDIDKLL